MMVGALETGQAQESRSSLEKRRQAILQQIAETNQQLTSTKQKKASAAAEYEAIQIRIDQRETLINDLKAAIDSTSTAIQTILPQMDSLVDDLNRIEKEYANMVREAYRIKLTNSWLAFLLSAESINDAFRRWRYLNQFEENRKRERKILLDLATELEIKRIELERQKADKSYYLEQLDQQNQILVDELSRKSDIITRLSSSERKLVATLNKKRKDQKKIEATIAKVIRANRPAANTAKADIYVGKDNSVIDASKLDPESRTFFESKGRLVWPLSSGFIVKPFGKQPHPDVPSVFISNNGIDIKSNNKETKVYAAANGKVVDAVYLPEFKNVLFVQHGIFITVYYNLSELFVQKGTSVQAGEVIGAIASAKTMVHFEIWQLEKKLNPAFWLP